VKKSSGFTLIELLVVLTILAILASIGLLGASRVIETAKRAKCVASLKQLGVATHLYLNDHDDRFFPYVSYGPDGRTWYFGYEASGSGGEGERDLDATRGPLFPYIQSVGKIELCPSFRYQSTSLGMKFSTASFGYGYNWLLGGRYLGRPLLHAGNVDAQTILFADSAQIKPFGDGAGEKIEEFYIVDERNVTVHFRHGQRANVLFVDGHVEAMAPYPGSLDARASEIGETIGRLTPVGSFDRLR